MSATKNRNQKIKLVVSNGSGAQAQGTVVGSELSPASRGGELWVRAHRSHVIKADDLRKHELRSYETQKLTETQIVHSDVGPVQGSLSGHCPRGALEGLKQNLKTLNDLHSRLRFMLKELEDLVIHESQ